MAKNVLVFQDLIAKLPVLREELRRLGAGVLIVTGGKDALEKATKMGAEAVLLGVTMPQMGGMEAFEAILIQSPQTKVFLIRRSPHELIPDAFKEKYPEACMEIDDTQQKVGAALVPLLGGDWQEYSKKDLRPPKDALEQRLAQRVTAKGEVAIEWKGARQTVELMNLSRTGVLFASDIEFDLGVEAPTHFALPNQEVLTVTVQIVRVKENQGHPRFSIGARFLGLSDEDLRKIDLWITALRFMVARAQGGENDHAQDHRAQSSARDALPPLGVGELDPKFVRMILNFRGPEVLTVLSHRSDPRLRWIQTLSNPERDAMDRTDGDAVKIQLAIAFRGKCGVFFDFIPTMIAHQKSLGDPLLNIFIAMVQDIESEEFAIGEAVERVATDHPEWRQELNAIVNELHLLKSRAISTVVQQMDRTQFAQHPAFVELEKKNQRNAGGFDEVKYDKKPEPKKEEKKKFNPFAIKISKKVKVSFAVLSVVAFAGVLFRAGSGYVSVSKLDLTFEITEAKRVDESSLELTCLLSQWEKLREEDKDSTMEHIEKFLTDERMKQAKLFDENGKLLAATAVVQRPVGKPPVYTRRIKKISAF